jgi:thiaminase/transcriptional activator TenA
MPTTCASTRALAVAAARAPSAPDIALFAQHAAGAIEVERSLHEGFAEALGALLPCYWIYWEVGKALIERGSPDPLYRRWIETYGGEEFAAVVGAVLELTDRLGPGLGERERARVVERFVTTSRYEWMFWDMGYQRQQWPTAVRTAR